MKTSFFRFWLLALCSCFSVAAFAESARAATFDITYGDAPNSGFNDATRGAARRSAFEAAVGVWQKRLTSAVPIVISAQFVPFGGQADSAMLAHAGPTQTFIDWNNSAQPRLPQTWYSSALANKLAGRDLSPPVSSSDSDADMEIVFNADVDNSVVLGDIDWYYGADGNAGNDIDFFSTAMHEIGHGLGFLSFINRNGGWGNYDPNTGQNAFPSIYERFLESGPAGSRIALTSMTLAQRAAAQTSDALFFNGPATRASNGGTAAKIYAPTTYQPGSSISHIDEKIYNDNNECITPVSSAVAHDPGPAMTGIMRDMGWTVANPDTTPPAVSCSYPLAGNLRFFAADGAGSASDPPAANTLVPRVQVHLWRKKTGWFWSGSGWFSSNATRLVDTPQVPSTFNGSNKTWRVAQSAWPSPAELYDREDYMLWVIAFDTAGNKTILSRALRIDSNPPVVGWNIGNGAAISNLNVFGGPLSQSNRVSFQIVETNAPATNRFWNGNAWQSAAPNGSGPELNGGIAGASWNRGATALPSAAQLRNGTFTLVVRAFNASGTVVLNVIHVVKRSETRAPTISISSPLSGATFVSFPPISGTAFDGESAPGVAGSGVLRADFALQRLADGKYWNGNAWTGPTGLQAPATRMANGNASWMYGGALPSGAALQNGNYRLQAFALDIAGNRSAAATSNFSILKAAARVASPSSVALSTITAKPDGTIRLTFTGALGASAGDASNYIVSDGAISIQTIAQPNASTVEFGIGALQSGTRISVAYDIEDSQGRAVQGTANVAVR